MAEVAELGWKPAAKESTLCVADPEFTPAKSTISVGSNYIAGQHASFYAQQRPPSYDIKSLATVNGWGIPETLHIWHSALRGQL